MLKKNAVLVYLYGVLFSTGENPLKIAGPVLFGVGGVLTLFCIFLVYCLNQRERHTWDEKLRGMVNKTM